MLSIETLYFSSTISRVTILLIFGVLLISQRNARYLWHWSVALLSSGLGTALTFYYGNKSNSSPLLSLIVTSLFLTSLVTSWSGLRLFYGRSVPIVWLALLPLLPSALYTFAVYVGVTIKVTLPFIYLIAAAISALALYEILLSANRRIFSQYLVAMAFAGYIVILGISAVLILAGMLMANAYDSYIVSMAFDQMASILVYFGYIAMTGERAALDLQRLAETDPLTALGNRRGGRRILERIHADANREECYSLLIGDIDHFKQVNDTLGHETGDAVLTLLSRRLTSAIRKHDSALRWGGEEFLIVLPDTDINEAERLAERLRTKVAGEPFMIGQLQLNVTLSIGIATYRVGDSTFENTLLRGDQALYCAKLAGRNRSSRQLEAPS
ncbi:GGDEF domain-containing protein [Pseudomonas sp.]|uniref:GGDEF domain-containing protein n=1 Tax=Pseudomonas sp. TaxID=306 RepID=UPI003FD8122D